MSPLLISEFMSLLLEKTAQIRYRQRSQLLLVYTRQNNIIWPLYYRTCLNKTNDIILPEEPLTNDKSWWWKCYALELLCCIRVWMAHHHRIHYRILHCTQERLTITWLHLSDVWSSIKSSVILAIWPCP